MVLCYGMLLTIREDSNHVCNVYCVHIYSYQNVSLQSSQINGRKSEEMIKMCHIIKMYFSTLPSLPHVCLEQWIPAWKGSIHAERNFTFFV